MSPEVLATFGFIGAVVMVMVDGHRALAVTTLAVAVGLAPTASASGGQPAALLLLVTPPLVVGLSLMVAAAAHHGGRTTGLDPLVPLFTPRAGLFGPRALRAVVAGLGLPIASWLAFNVPVAGVASVHGLMFPAAYVWICASGRLLVARTIEDLAVAVSAIGMAAATAWLLRGGPQVLGEAAEFLTLPLLASLAVGWLEGRYRRAETHVGEAGG